MLTALLCTAAVLTASPPDADPEEASSVTLRSRAASNSGWNLKLGLDATEVFPAFGRRPPKVPAHLLAVAPTSPTAALVASTAATVTGALTATAFILVMTLNPFFPVVSAIVGVGVGLLVAAFGPGVGALMNGEVRPFLLQGALRFLAVFPLALLGGWGIFAWLGWLAHDVSVSRHAPARWVERHLVTASDGAASVSLVPGDGSVVRVRF